MFDRHRLRDFMKFRRLSPSELADRIGVDRHTITRVLSGKTANPNPDLVSRLVRELRTSLDTFDPDAAAQFPWSYFGWQSVDRVRELCDEMRSADALLTCTKGMPAYLQHREVHDWAFMQAHQAAGWSFDEVGEALRTIIHSGNIDAKAYQLSKCRHRVIAREWWADQVFAHEPDWADGMRRIIRELDGKAIVGLVPEEGWRSVDQLVTATVKGLIGPPGQWDLVTLAVMHPNRPVLGVVRPSRDVFLVTHHPPYLGRLMRAFLSAREHVPNFEAALPLIPSSLSDLKAGVVRTVSQFEGIARNAMRHRKVVLPETKRRANLSTWARLALPPTQSLETRLDQ